MFEKDFEKECVAAKEASELMKSSAFITDMLTPKECDGMTYAFERYLEY